MSAWSTLSSCVVFCSSLGRGPNPQSLGPAMSLSLTGLGGFGALGGMHLAYGGNIPLARPRIGWFELSVQRKNSTTNHPDNFRAQTRMVCL